MQTLEFLGVFFGLICVYFNIKQNIWGWIAGIFSTICYVFVFFESKLYADLVLQLFFIVLSLHGILAWLKKDDSGNSIPVSRASKKEIIYFIIGMPFFSGVLVGILDKYTDSDVPFLDSITTIISIYAQIWLAKKRIENWILWIIADFIYIYLYFQKDLFLTLILYSIFTVMALFGYQKWLNDLKKQEN